jgi:hypothetical protein
MAAVTLSRPKASPSLVVAVIPAAVLAFRVSGFVLGIPWSQMLTLLGAIYLAAILIAFHGAASLRSREGLRPD